MKTNLPLIPRGLLLRLFQWHLSDNLESRPSSFPGPFAPATELLQWLTDVRRKCNTWEIHRLQRANAVISWLSSPQGTQNNGEFRAFVIRKMRKKREQGDLLNDRFWEWEDFKRVFLEMCVQYKEDEVVKKNLRIAGQVAAIAGGLMLLPLAAPMALGALGFSTGGVVAGSFAAWAQSTFWGGATGGVFSVLQSAGATAVIPAVGEIITGVGLVGSGTAIAAAASLGEGPSFRPVGQKIDDVQLTKALRIVGNIGDISLNIQ